jgi:hypothetical protein
MKSVYFSRNYEQFLVFYNASKYKSLHVVLTDIQLSDKWVIVFVKYIYIYICVEKFSLKDLLQGDEKVSVHLMITIKESGAQRLLITLYKPLKQYRVSSSDRLHKYQANTGHNISPPRTWRLEWNIHSMRCEFYRTFHAQTVIISVPSQYLSLLCTSRYGLRQNHIFVYPTHKGLRCNLYFIRQYMLSGISTLPLVIT